MSTPSGRRAVLDAGRQAAARRRQADADDCRTRVEQVIEAMRRRKKPLTDIEITRQADVNPQYLQRHRDLRARAKAVRADLAGDQAKAALATRSETEAALQVENHMLIEQNAQLRRDLAAARTELKALRAESLASRACGTATGTVERQLREQLDQATATARQAQAEVITLRNLNQRLMVENSRLLDNAGGR